MMSLRAYLTGELEGVDDLLLPPLDFFQSIPSLKSHLEIEADDLEDLLISRLEAKVLFVSIELGFALDYELDVFFLIDYWEGKEL